MNDWKELISEAMWMSGSVAEVMKALGGNSISIEMAYLLRHGMEKTYELICEAQTAVEELENEAIRVEEKYQRELAGVKALDRFKDVPRLRDTPEVDDDPDWVVDQKAKALEEEKEPEKKEPFPVPVGSARAKEICAKVNADLKAEDEAKKGYMVGPDGRLKKRKPGRPRKQKEEE